MPASLNRVLLAGEVAGASELRYTTSGEAVARVILAVHGGHERPHTESLFAKIEHDHDGHAADGHVVTRIPLEGRGSFADAMTHLRKGQHLLVEGWLRKAPRPHGTERMPGVMVEVTRLQKLDPPASGEPR